MDIALLSEMVGELILDHDQVGLPGVGTFVAEVVPASFSDKGYTINPPYRRLSFYSSRLEEDLLIDFYASHNNLDRAAAKAYLTAFLAEMKTVLKDRKVVTFPGLGRLRATKENAFFFVPDEDLDIYPDGFGLDSVSLKSHHESREEVSIAVSDLASILSSIPAAEPEPVAEPVVAPAEAPEPEPVQPIAEPTATATPAADATPAPNPQDTDDYTMSPERRTIGWVGWLLIVLGVVVLFFAAFFITSRVAPDFMDTLLYSEEELRIINYR